MARRKAPTETTLLEDPVLAGPTAVDADPEPPESVPDGGKKSRVPKAKKPTGPVWQNRIIEHGVINPKEVLKHNRNFRDHPRFQQEEMDRVLDLIGWIDEIIISARTNRLINGHLRLDRALKAKQPTIPYKKVDLSEAEEQTALLTFDYIGGLAQVNAQKQDGLLKDVEALWAKQAAGMVESQKQAMTGLMESVGDKLETVLGFTDLPDFKPPATVTQIRETIASAETDDEVPAVLPGAFELKEWVDFERGQPYDIPPLRPDMLATCPTPIACWTTPDGSPVVPNYVTVFGNGNLRGLPFERTILLTHTNDINLDILWSQAKDYTKRFINRKYYAVMSPEYSSSMSFSKAERIWATFRNRWMGRYFQEAGLRVIPTVSHVDNADDLEFLYAGIPIGCPCVSTQAQAHNDELEDMWEKSLAVYRRSYEEIIRRIQPKQIIIYGGKMRTRIIQELQLDRAGPEIISIENFMGTRTRYRQQAEDNNKT